MNFCVWYEVGIKALLFLSGYLVILASFVENTFTVGCFGGGEGREHGEAI